MMPILSTGPIALVLPGEAMWGTFQTGFVTELGARLQSAGYGNQPFHVTIGSSSGSLIATMAAAGGPFDHGFARSVWLEFGRATRLSLRSRPINPYPAALKGVFDRGLVDTEKASSSHTQLIVTASRVQAGVDVFSPRYFSNKPAFCGNRDQWTVTSRPKDLRRAVEASSRVPILYGWPVFYGAQIFIDGVFADNAPVELALESGARHVFVVTSSRKGNVFERPVQSLLRRQFLTLFPRLQETIPPSQPLDLEDLRSRFPSQSIHVIHPQEDITVSRFFETRPEVLGRLYDMGREAAQMIS